MAAGAFGVAVEGSPSAAGSPPWRRHRQAVAAAVAVLVAIGAVIALLHLNQLDSVMRRIERGDPALLALAMGLEALSFAGYVLLTRAAFRPAASRIGWRESAEITLAGVVATRLLAAGGAGGIALTVWALRAAGLDARTAVRRLSAFLVTLYSVFFVALLVAGAGLASGLLPGQTPAGVALLGTALAGAVLLLALALLVAPGDIERRVQRAARGTGRGARLARRLATGPAVAHEAMRAALALLRSDRSAAAGAIAWWAFDIAVLAAAFEAFGRPPPVGVLVFCYFLGQLANAIPVPGGIGPVEGGLIAAFVASGVPADLAVVAVVSYQAVSTWVPAAPGLYGYWRLRGTVARWRTAPKAPAMAGPDAAGG